MLYEYLIGCVGRGTVGYCSYDHVGRKSNASKAREPLGRTVGLKLVRRPRFLKSNT